MQVEHKTEKGTIIFIKVPDEANDPSLKSPNGTMPYFSIDYKLSNGWSGGFALFYKDFGGKKKYPSKLEIIGLTSEITEEQVKMMVDYDFFWSNVFNKNLKNYKNYIEHEYTMISALDSFKSLMQYLNIFETNPIPKPPKEVTGENVDWQIGYSKVQETIGKWIVLFKPN